MAAVGIPDYRLPRDVLRAEVALVERMGAEIVYGHAIGVDMSLDDLLARGYGAVFLAIGAQLGHRLGIAGESPAPRGYYLGIDYLRRLNSGEPLGIGHRVVVVGGGNVAMDCARSARRSGAEVHIVYRRVREAMPADPDEVRDAEEEGVQLHFLCNPISVRAAEGAVTGVECLRMRLGEPDASGRRRPVPIEGSGFDIACDTLLPAIGQSVDLSWLAVGEGLGLSRQRTLAVDPDTLATNLPGVYAGGDCVTGPASIIEAMAAGTRASESIDQYLRTGRPVVTDQQRRARVARALSAGDEPPVDRLGAGAARVAMATRPAAERSSDFEPVELGFTPEEALREAQRCLRCYRLVLLATER
jgi:formate dehydrogenase beta subunit